MKSYSINLKEDSIIQLFIKIAIPSSIGTIFQNLYSVIDSIFAGKMISTYALAAIGQIFPIYFVIIALGVGLGIGSTSLIANNIGSNNLNKAAQVFAQSFVLSIIVAIIISFIGINFSEIIIRTINENQKTLNYSTQYINIIFIGSVFIFILITLNSSLSAQGDTKSYRNVLIFSFILNILLNPILITGKFFGMKLFIPLGISGIAIATILSQFVGIFYLLFKIKKTIIYNSIKLIHFIPNLSIIKSILSHGIPASIGLMMIAVGSYILLFFVAYFGNNAIAGYTAATRYEQLFFLPLLGLSTAVISIVGQNFGGKNYERVKETHRKALMLGIFILIILGLIMYFTSELAMTIFTTNVEAIEYGSTYLKISAFMFPAFPFFFINNATFQGLKKPIIVMFMAILRFVVIPIIVLSLIIFLIDKNFVYIFIALVFMHWFIAIFYFIFSKYKIESILCKAIEFRED